ncbi:MAG: cytidine deaminase [Prevotella sp.]|nr:cytidine deaminase [Prevotella sp.]MBQ9187070.1 cytidine deaminase [Prevotella sp.]
MEELTLKSTVQVAHWSELTNEERLLIEKAKESTYNSYAPYSHFHVGAAILLENGVIIPGCNQENAAFPAGLCAERSAIFAAGAQYPDQPVLMLAIAVRNAQGEFLAEPASPCGSCRQVIIETETRFKRPVRILLYGTTHTYIMDGIKQLMPLSFTEF